MTRDLAILLEEFSRDPSDARWCDYLGQTHEGLRQHDEAANAYRACVDRDGWAAEGASACFRAAMCLKEVGRYREAETHACLGLARVPRSAELLWIAGFCAYQQDAMQRAIEWCELAITCGQYLHPDFHDRRLRPTFAHLAAQFEAPQDVLRFAYARIGQPERAAVAQWHYDRAKAARLVGER